MSVTAIKEGIAAEWRLIVAFLTLSAVDAVITTVAVSRGYLATELSPHMRSLFTVWGPPHYSYETFWAVKMGLTVAFVPALVILRNKAPRIGRLAFVIPVAALATICLIGSVGLVNA